MKTRQDTLLYLAEVKKRFAQEMPKIRKEIRLYESKKAKGKLNKYPTPASQFNA